MSDDSFIPMLDQIAVLAIDTCFNECSVALITPSVRDICRSNQPRKHADDVLPLVESMLTKHSLALTSISAIAMISGPGSFTGLRIGASVTQGLAFGIACPVVCISSLAIMAYDSLLKSANQKTAEYVCVAVCLHARESEFYFGIYKFDRDCSPVAILPDQIIDSEKLKFALNQFVATRAEQAIPSICIGAGQGWAHALLDDTQTSFNEILISPGCDALLLADLAIQRVHKGLTISPETATPVYLNDDMQYRTV